MVAEVRGPNIRGKIRNIGGCRNNMAGVGYTIFSYQFKCLSGLINFKPIINEDEERDSLKFEGGECSARQGAIWQNNKQHRVTLP